MKLKSILKSFILFTLAVFVLMIFAGCKEDELSKLFAEGELGDFWSLEKDNAEIVAPPNEGNDGDGDVVIDDEDDTLNMDSVRKLAQYQITPAEFMKKYPGTVTGENPSVYRLPLPNDYVVHIEYTGDTINIARLEDLQLGMQVDLLDGQGIDMFLLERSHDE
ncbi:MAG: hypothetical protein FWF92_05055 [Oscillospiraceae bacterium]|nr:hypothetical protein [Oscillospiraceae bacterium]